MPRCQGTPKVIVCGCRSHAGICVSTPVMGDGQWGWPEDTCPCRGVIPARVTFPARCLTGFELFLLTLPKLRVSAGSYCADSVDKDSLLGDRGLGKGRHPAPHLWGGAWRSPPCWKPAAQVALGSCSHSSACTSDTRVGREARLRACPHCVDREPVAVCLGGLAGLAGLTCVRACVCVSIHLAGLASMCVCVSIRPLAYTILQRSLQF